MKVHLAMGKYTSRCGRWLYDDLSVPECSWLWVPERARCVTCRRAHGVGSYVRDEHVIAVEAGLHALAADTSPWRECDAHGSGNNPHVFLSHDGDIAYHCLAKCARVFERCPCGLFRHPCLRGTYMFREWLGTISTCSATPPPRSP